MEATLLENRRLLNEILNECKIGRIERAQLIKSVDRINVVMGLTANLTSDRDNKCADDESAEEIAEMKIFAEPAEEITESAEMKIFAEVEEITEIAGVEEIAEIAEMKEIADPVETDDSDRDEHPPPPYARIGVENSCIVPSPKPLIAANKPIIEQATPPPTKPAKAKPKYPSYCTNIKSCWGHMWEHEQKDLLTLFGITEIDIQVIIEEINDDIKISTNESEQSAAEKRKIRDALYKKYAGSKKGRKLLNDQKLKKRCKFDQLM